MVRGGGSGATVKHNGSGLASTCAVAPPTTCALAVEEEGVEVRSTGPPSRMTAVRTLDVDLDPPTPGSEGGCGCGWGWGGGDEAGGA